MSVVTSFSKGLLASLFVFSVVLLSGCQDDDDGDKNPPVISNLSHADNEKVIGNRTITFSAEATDDSSHTVTITHNGNPVTVTPSGNTYSASITLEDRTNNAIVVTAKDAVNITTETITLNYPFLAFTNGQAASVVIGQADFNGSDPNRGGVVAANGFDDPRGITIVNGRLYIVDSANNRVLGYQSIPTSDQNADFVIGQSNFETNSSGLGATQLKSPHSVSSDGIKLLVSQGVVSDTNGAGNVHQWNTVPVSNQAADNVIGETGFGVETTACNNSTIGFSSSGTAFAVYIVNNNVIAADTANNRVLIWNSIPSDNGVPADIVLGQDSFTECLPNDVNHNGVSDDTGLSASTLSAPFGLWSDGTRLAVADANNARVLIWNTFPTDNAQPANVVLGQSALDVANFDTETRSATNFLATDIASNGNQFFATDFFGSRLLIWDTFPAASNQPADKVLGKSTLTSNAGLDSNASIGQSRSIFSHDNHLFVSSTTFNRVLIFNPQ